MSEIWKDIDGYEGVYQISNVGRVKSLSRIVMGGRNNASRVPVGERILCPKVDKNGYHEYALSLRGKQKYVREHRLVLLAFKPIDNPDDLQCNHINGIKDDNRVDNLEWVTASENILHSFYELGNRDKLNLSGLNKGHRVIKSNLDGELVEEYRSIRQASESNRVSRETITKKSKSGDSHKGFYWRVIA